MTVPAQGSRMVIVFSLLVSSLLACNSVVPSPGATAIPDPTETRPATMASSTMVLTPTRADTPPATRVPPTPTAGSNSCPSPRSPEFSRPSRFSDYPAVIEAFLSAGGSVDTLEGKLEAWGALPEVENQVAVADLTGDGANEVIVALADPGSTMVTPPGALVIFGCSEGRYVRLYREGPADEDTFNPAIELVRLGDVNLDDVPDVLYVLKTCGAHTCYERLRILGWDGAQLTNLMGGTLELPYPSYVVEPGKVEARSAGIGSVGAEPQRGYAEVWEWNGNVFTITKRIYAPPLYRYHALLDGDRALRSAGYVTATETYRRVIHDDGLQEWSAESGTMTAAAERAELSAFARWRLVLVYLLTDRNEEARAVYEDLQEGHPAGTMGHDVAAMAETFWDAYQRAGRVAQGCAAVMGTAEEHTSILEFFNLTYGYGNPWWEPQDLCPFVQQDDV